MVCLDFLNLNHLFKDFDYSQSIYADLSDTHCLSPDNPSPFQLLMPLALRDILSFSQGGRVALTQDTNPIGGNKIHGSAIREQYKYDLLNLLYRLLGRERRCLALNSSLLVIVIEI